MFYYVYILLSKKDGKFYSGYTKDLQLRVDKHNNGEITSTKYRRPFQLIYYEACLDQQDDLRREKYLKTTYGKRYIRNRLKNSLA